MKTQVSIPSCLFCVKFYKTSRTDRFSTLELVVSPDETRLHVDVSANFAGSTEDEFKVYQISNRK